MNVGGILFLLILGINIIGIIIMTVERHSAGDYGALVSSPGKSFLLCAIASGILPAIMIWILSIGEYDPQAIYFISGAAFKGGTNWMIVFGAFIFGVVISGFLIQLVSALLAKLFLRINLSVKKKIISKENDPEKLLEVYKEFLSDSVLHEIAELRLRDIIAIENNMDKLCKIYNELPHMSELRKMAEPKIRDMLAKEADLPMLVKIADEAHSGSLRSLAYEMSFDLCKHDWQRGKCKHCGMRSCV